MKKLQYQKREGQEELKKVRQMLKVFKSKKNAILVLVDTRKGLPVIERSRNIKLIGYNMDGINSDYFESEFDNYTGVKTVNEVKKIIKSKKEKSTKKYYEKK
jgi:ABC-type uncharacterized transport system substrate-binding protein